jgi:hypothetical protein
LRTLSVGERWCANQSQVAAVGHAIDAWFHANALALGRTIIGVETDDVESNRCRFAAGATNAAVLG